MPTKIKIVSACDFLQVTPEGTIDMATSRRLIIDIAKTEHPPADYELLVDFRDTQCTLSLIEVCQLAGELCLQGDTFRRKVALLVLPGFNFDRASFFETCSHNRGFSVNAFTDYEGAMRWMLSVDEPTVGPEEPNKPLATMPAAFTPPAALAPRQP
jgi:hypothetical protein